MEQLEGKVAVVTGAASGIGEGMARRFAREGMRLVLADIDEAGLGAVVDDLADEGCEVVGVRTDVGRAADIEALAQATLDTYGLVHVVCNNAGVGTGGSIDDLTVEDWAWVIDVDLWSVIHGMRVFLPLLKAHDEGHVVNTASVAGLFSAPFMGPYNAAKAAVVAVSETAFNELAMAGSNVGVSVLCPSWVKTRIADSDRNRPGGPAAEPTDPESAATATMIREFIQSFIDGGIDPADVADQVVEAIRVKRFYILTHGDTAAAVRARFDAITGDGTPPMLMH